MKPVETLRSHVREWMEVPGELSNREEWFFRAVSIGYPLGSLVHALFVVLFYRWGVTELVLFNLMSVPFYGVVLVLARHGKLLLSYFLVATEVNLHAALGVYFLGWGSGLQYHVLASIIACLMIDARNTVKFVTGFGQIMLFVFLFLLTSTPRTPAHAVAPVEMQALNIFNIISAFGITAFITAYYINIAGKAEAALRKEHRKSERLLRNVLPITVANRLKENPGTIADRFSSASILFGDLVGFSEVAEELEAERLVDRLNDLFSRFDNLVEKHGLEKIKTIGDEYMVAAGLPVERRDHAEAIARFAIEMRDELGLFNRDQSFDFDIRIGINSGEVVAGVIGKKRFLYDLWGEPVNLASRMESSGVPGKIQITEHTRSLLGSRFTVRKRGELEVSGFGTVTTYFLTGADDT